MEYEKNINIKYFPRDLKHNVDRNAMKMPVFTHCIYAPLSYLDFLQARKKHVPPPSERSMTHL